MSRKEFPSNPTSNRGLSKSACRACSVSSAWFSLHLATFRYSRSGLAGKPDLSGIIARAGFARLFYSCGSCRLPQSGRGRKGFLVAFSTADLAASATALDRLVTRAKQGGQMPSGGTLGLLHTAGFGPVDFQWKGVLAGPSVAPFGTGQLVRLLGRVGACQTRAESRTCWAFQWGYKFHPSRNVGLLAADIPRSGLPFPAGAG